MEPESDQVVHGCPGGTCETLVYCCKCVVLFELLHRRLGCLRLFQHVCSLFVCIATVSIIILPPQPGSSLSRGPDYLVSM